MLRCFQCFLTKYKQVTISYEGFEVIHYSHFWSHTSFLHCSDDHKPTKGSAPSQLLERYAGWKVCAPTTGAFGEVGSSTTRHRADHLSACWLSTGAPFTSFPPRSRTNTSSPHSLWSAGQRVKHRSNLIPIFRYYQFFRATHFFFSHQGLKLEICYLSQCCALHLLFRSHLSKLTDESSWTPVLNFPFSSHCALKMSRAYSWKFPVHGITLCTFSV